MMGEGMRAGRESHGARARRGSPTSISLGVRRATVVVEWKA